MIIDINEKWKKLTNILKVLNLKIKLKISFYIAQTFYNTHEWYIAGPSSCLASCLTLSPACLKNYSYFSTW